MVHPFPFTEQELVTPPLSGLILPGITRDSILHMTRQWGKFKVSEAKITMPMVCDLLNQGRVSNPRDMHLPRNQLIWFFHTNSYWSSSVRERRVWSVR